MHVGLLVFVKLIPTPMETSAAILRGKQTGESIPSLQRTPLAPAELRRWRDIKGVAMKRRLLLLAPLLIAGCATVGPIYQPPPEPISPYALLVIYREPGLAGAAWPHRYYVDKLPAAELRVNNYTYVYVRQGKRAIHYGGTPDFDKLRLEVDMRAGETYYFKEGRSLGYQSLTDTVQLVPKEKAQLELKTFQFLEPIVSRIE